MTRLEAIRERESKATKGTWKSDIDPCQDDMPFIYKRTSGEALGLIVDVNLGTIHDADFIAHARQDIPYLLHRLELAEDLIKAHRTQIGIGGAIDAYNAFVQEGEK